jgi:hypothetical protein
MTQPVCEACGRKIPTEAADSPRDRSVFSVMAPKGEHAKSLVHLLEDISQQWADAGAIPPGEKSWRFRNLHMVLYSVATAPADVRERLMPREAGG